MIIFLVEPPTLECHYLHIEPSASTRATSIGQWLDPQHGGSKLDSGGLATRVDQPMVLPERLGNYLVQPAACTAAFFLPRHNVPDTIVLRKDAGVDDFLAAAIASGWGIDTFPYSDSMLWRLATVAKSDNADYSGLGPWQPGQRLEVTHTTFPGLARLCACHSLPVKRR